MPTLELTTVIGCPLRCTFCPQDELIAAYGARGHAPSSLLAQLAPNERVMTLGNLAHYLRTVPKHVRIDFSGFSEPWTNRDCTAMLDMVLRNGYSVAIYTTLHGMKAPSLVMQLLDAYASQVETVVVHLPDATDNMRGHNYSLGWHAALEMFVEQRNELWNKGVRIEFMTMNGIGKVHPSIKSLIGDVAPWLGNTRAGNLPDAGPVEYTPRNCGPLSCSYTPFYDQNVLLPDGTVVLCCMDYGLRHVLGNLLEDDYYEILGAGLTSVRSENMHQGDCATLCATCSRAQRWELNANTKQVWDKVA